jgi:hypothetical protein
MESVRQASKAETSTRQHTLMERQGQVHGIAKVFGRDALDPSSAPKAQL